MAVKGCLLYSIAICAGFTLTPSNALAEIIFHWAAASPSSTVQPQIINGTKPENPLNWAASFWTPTGPQTQCTSTLVGPKTLLTAAHCVDDGAVISIDMGSSGMISAECHETTGFQPKESPADPSSDYALCLLNKPIPFTKIPPERINIDPTAIKIGATLLLTGFGCTAYPAGEGPGVFRTGTAEVKNTPGQVVSEPNTILVEGQAVLCLGDSGGASFLENQIAKTRRIVAVNSRFFVPNSQSYLSSTSSKVALGFLQSWVETKKTGICGINFTTGCR